MANKRDQSGQDDGGWDACVPCLFVLGIPLIGAYLGFEEATKSGKTLPEIVLYVVGGLVIGVVVMFAVAHGLGAGG